MNFVDHILSVTKRPPATTRALRSLLCGLFILALPLLLAGCSGGDVGATAAPAGATGTSATTTSNGYTLYLSLSKTSIITNNSDSAEVTATLLKENEGQEGQEIIFSVSDGQLSSNTATTDLNGEAKITVKSGPGASNQLISITATSNGASVSIPLQITGNTLTLELPQVNMAQGSAPQLLTAILKRADNSGIFDQTVTFSVISGAGVVSLSPSSALTDVNGKATTMVSAPAIGTAIIEASSLGASKQIEVKVAAAAEVFEIVLPTTDTATLETNTGELLVTVNAPSQANVTFLSNLVSSLWNGVDDTVTVPVVDGSASATLTSAMGGLATVTVYDPLDFVNQQDSLSVQVYAPAAEANNITLQLSQNNIAVTPVGASSRNSVTLTAYVKNADNFAVGGALVSFSLANTTNGGESISPAIAITNSAGVATSTFYSGSQGSSGDGVKITAKVVNTAIETSQYITIRDLAGSVAIGRGNKITIVDNTTYKQDITVQVTDSNNSPVPSAIVTLNLWPVGYHMGAEAFNEDGECIGYYHNEWPDCSGKDLVLNEDENRNMIKDPDEDTGPLDLVTLVMTPDGFLTPHNSTGGSIPATVTTLDDGMATFQITYLKRYAFWVAVELTASVQVQGTETQAKMQWTLDAAADEFEACDLFRSDFGYFIPSVCP